MAKISVRSAFLIVLVMFGLAFGSCAMRPDVALPDKYYPDIVDISTDKLEMIDGTVLINEDTIIESGLLREMREYAFPNGDIFYQERITAAEQHVSADTSAVSGEPSANLQKVATFSLVGENGTIRYYSNDEKVWVEEPLTEGTYPVKQYFIDTAGRSVIIVPPQAYLPQENQMLEAMPAHNGVMQVTKGVGDYLISLFIPEADYRLQYEYMYMRSSQSLIDWQDEHDDHRWKGYLFAGDNRWCWEGYYYLAPSTYLPSGENYYHRLPAAYIAAKMAYYDNRAAKAICIAMLDVMLDLQNEDGYFPTYAGSGWLLEDYGIKPGFYDTRFNSDLVYGLIKAAETYQVPRFLEAVIDYGKFYLRFAAENHYVITSSSGEIGWLVYDYWQEDNFITPHTSLNHQAAQIIVLFMLGDITGNNEYIQIADYMINGITLLGSSWVKSNHDLYYAYMGGNEMGRNDYPYLTYNDLYDLQEVLEAHGRERNETIQYLMNEKKRWMDNNRISDYKK